MKKIDKEEILQAAIRVFNRNPEARYMDVAEEAGIGRATLYRHYPSKEHLLIEIAKISNKEIAQIMVRYDSPDKSSAEARFLGALEEIIGLGDKFYFLNNYYFLYEVDEIREHMKNQEAFIRERLTDVAAQREKVSDVPLDWRLYVVDQLVYLAWNSIKQGEMDRSRAARCILDMIF